MTTTKTASVPRLAIPGIVPPAAPAVQPPRAPAPAAGKKKAPAKTAALPAPLMSVRHLNKKFGDHEVLREIDFNVYPGDVVCIIGASGSGKSTLLRCMNMLETPTGGSSAAAGRISPA